MSESGQDAGHLDEPPGGHHDHDDDLPDRDDPYWAELTTQTLAYLRRLRAAERRRKLGSTAYTAYVVLVIVLMYVVPYLWYALTRPHGAGPAVTAPGWALGAAGLTGLVVVAFLRDGSWRGPAVLDRPSAAWLLPAPIDRRDLLVPRWRTALIVACLAGTGIGAVLGLVVRVVTGGPAAAMGVSAALAGLVVTASGTALGGLVSAGSGRRAARLGPWTWLLPVAAFAAVAGTATPAPRGAPVTGLAALALWSGPWGWSVQPFVAALPGRAPAGVESLWPAGAALAVAAAVLLVIRADRAVATIDARTLRARADSVAFVGGSLLMLQPRRARLTVLAAQGHAPSTRWRLPVPRHRLLLGVWRDATALLRAPARTVWALIWLVGAVALLAAARRQGLDVGAPAAGSVAARTVTGERLLLGVPGLVALYLAAAQLAEPARLDADDVRRLRIRPTAATRQALTHAVLPVVVLGAVLLLALGVTSLVTGLPPGTGATAWRVADGSGHAVIGVAVLGGLWEALAALPVMVGAALVSAYRGEVPTGLLGGGSSPMGDAGPAALLAWYARAPLVALLLLLPTLLGWSVAGTVTAVAAVALLTWAGMRAESMLRA